MSTDEIAARLARLVADVLERPTVAPDQDVFALGADSLQAIELLARVQDEWGVEVSLEELFAAPTAAALAAVVERARAADRVGSATEPASDPAAIPLTRRPRQEPEERLPLSFAQRRLWFLHQLEPNNPVHNLGAAVRLQGRLDVPALDAALREIVRRHEVLRTGYLAAGAEPAQVVMPARFAAETAPLSLIHI